jgi:hypothetical protein
MKCEFISPKTPTIKLFYLSSNPFLFYKMYLTFNSYTNSTVLDVQFSLCFHDVIMVLIYIYIYT